MTIEGAAAIVLPIMGAMGFLAIKYPRIYRKLKWRFYILIALLSFVPFSFCMGGALAVDWAGREWHVDRALSDLTSETWAIWALWPSCIGGTLFLTAAIFGVVADHLFEEGKAAVKQDDQAK